MNCYGLITNNILTYHFVWCCLLLQTNSLSAQEKIAPNIYLVRFTDKRQEGFQLSAPEKYLSARALQRRSAQSIPIKENDLPVPQAYIDSLKKMGFSVLNASKWLNAVSVQTSDTELIGKLASLSFVRPYIKKAQQPSSPSFRCKNCASDRSKIRMKNDRYGQSLQQIAIHRGDFLHNQGKQGQGMIIAVIDAGFKNANTMTAFDSLWLENRVLLHRDTHNAAGNLFNEDAHGSEVLSILASAQPGYLIGTAPKATYILLRSEDASYETNGVQREYLVEEFNWAVAAELADSIGADVINSSLGYTTFNDAQMNHTYQDMDGKTAMISIAASLASGKGMIVVASAGNEGTNTWKYISAPADADSIITVGAIDANGTKAAFSSVGPTFDRRIKPDVVAIGHQTVFQSPDNSFLQGNGTSFSAPIISGLTACLWQAFPQKSNIEIIRAIRESSSRYDQPDSLLGYGIPNFEKAYASLKSMDLPYPGIANIWPNPFTDEFKIKLAGIEGQATIAIINIAGEKKIIKTVAPGYLAGNIVIISELKALPRGAYIIEITTDSGTFKGKIIKQ